MTRDETTELQDISPFGDDSNVIRSSSKHGESQPSVPSTPKRDGDLESTEERVSPKSARFYVAFAANMTALLLVTLDLTIVPGALPAIAQDLKASSSEAYWVGSAYILSQAVSQPILGGLSEILGRKTAIQASLGIFVIASILCSRAKTIHWLIGTRVMQGIGGGGLYAISLMLVTDLTSLQERSKWMSIMSISYALGNLGLVLGSGIAEHTTWRWIFYINIPTGVICFTALQFSLRLTQERSNLWTKLKSIDWLGMAVLGASLASLLLGLLSGGVSHPWNSAAVIVPLAIVCLGLIIFVAAEHFAQKPVLPMEMLRNPSMLISMVASFTSAFCVIVFAYFLIVYFHGSAGYSIIHSAVAVLPLCLTIPFWGIVGGIVITKTGDYRIPLVIGSLASIGGMASILALRSDSSVALQTGIQIPTGLGLGFLYIASGIGPQATLPPHLQATGSVLIALMRALGQAFGIAIGAAIFQNEFSKHVTALVDNHSLPIEFAVSGSEAQSAYAMIQSFPAPFVHLYRVVYYQSLHFVWVVAAVLVALPVLLAYFAKKGNLKGGQTSQQRLIESEGQKN